MFIPLYEIVFVVSYLLTQKLRFENVLGRGATREGGGEKPPLLVFEDREKNTDLGKKRS